MATIGLFVFFWFGFFVYVCYPEMTALAGGKKKKGRGK
jgi:hypothetical protein